MPGRQFVGATGYAFGFNGKESDDEIKGNGNSLDFGARIYDPRLGIFLSGDPKMTEFPAWSPYNALGDNPIRNIDPDGKKFINFDKDGNYIGTTKDNWFHNTFMGTHGRILDDDGNVTKKFSFADPTNDFRDIQNKVITKLVIVAEKDIQHMMTESGASDPHNNISQKSPADGRFDYISKEGQGNGKLDFSYRQIPGMYPGASPDPLAEPSPLIFLVGDMAHNQMNFGNFLFGQAGQFMGFLLPELKAGAHYNSLDVKNTFHPDKRGKGNGYPPCLDSSDDQLSIQKGYENGLFNNKTAGVEVGTAIPINIISDDGKSTPIEQK